MKRGDKIVCIKNFFNNRLDRIDLESLSDEELRKVLNIGLERWNKMNKELYFRNKSILLKGKVYEVKGIFAGVITISSNQNHNLHVKYAEPEGAFLKSLDNHYDILFSDYFVTYMEARKLKLQELSDTNFLEFLKRLKT